MYSTKMLSLIRIFGAAIALILFAGQVIHATQGAFDFFIVGFLVTVMISYLLLFLARFYDFFSGVGIRKLQITLVIFSAAYIINELMKHQLPFTVRDYVALAIRIGYIILPEIIFEVLWEVKKENIRTGVANAGAA